MKKILLLGLISVLLFGCNSWIDEDSSSIYDKSATFNSMDEIYASLYGGYSLLQSRDLYGARVSRFISDEASDLVRNISPGVWNKGTWGISKGEFFTWWRGNYALIGAANNFIYNISNVDETIADSSIKRELSAEMKFLRALGYLNLVMAYGRVPLITYEPQDLSEVTYPSRASLKDLYDLMISDLSEAEKVLPIVDFSSSQDGRATRGAAASLLAKVYLTKASSEAASESDFQNAANILDDLISGHYGAYGLCENISEIYNPDYEGGKEHIFSIKFDLPPAISSNIVLGYSPKTLYPAQGTAVPICSNTFVSSFDVNNDKRFSYGIINKHPQTGEYLHKQKYYFFAKFQDDKKTLAGADRCDFLYLRFADVLLMHSEALHRGNISKSKSGYDKYYGINEVRRRARTEKIVGDCKIPDLDNSFTGDFLSTLLQERAFEFYCEGKRRWDILRIGNYSDVMGNYYLSEGITGGKIDEIRVLFPIPLLEIEANPNLIPDGESNNGYVSTGEGEEFE